MFPICFVSPLFLGIESKKCVTSYSTGTMAQWPIGENFYNHLEVSSITPAFVFVFVFEKGMFPLLKICVNGSRYRSPEGSL